MTQLILNGITLPESKKRYRAWPEEGSVSVEMINRRLVKELRGDIWRVSYQYGYFSDAEKNALLAALELGRRQPISCTFLPPSSSTMLTRPFWVTDIQYPTFMWSAEGNPLWADFAFELREVEPSD